jgi:hypothetical protein
MLGAIYPGLHAALKHVLVTCSVDGLHTGKHQTESGLGTDHVLFTTTLLMVSSDLLTYFVENSQELTYEVIE